MRYRQEQDDDKREWWLEGHLISRSKDVWHPLYGPMFNDVCRRLLSKFISLDDDALEKIDPTILEYDDFRIRQHVYNVPRSERGKPRKPSTATEVVASHAKRSPKKVVKSRTKIKVRIKR